MSEQHSAAEHRTKEAFCAAVHRHIRQSLGMRPEHLSPHDKYAAVALAARDYALAGLQDTQARVAAADAKRLYYLSMEFLLGRSLCNNLHSLQLMDVCGETEPELGIDFGELAGMEEDAGLGNGGLGRLAACFLDSLATLDMPGYGYGINYEYGMLKQVIEHGYQRARPDHWLKYGSYWEIERPDEAVLVPLYGRIEPGVDREGAYNPMWLDWQVIIGVPFDMPIVGHGATTVNYLRLFSARASHEFDMEIFNEGDYLRAVEQKIQSENVSKVLYPADSFEAGRELRLTQEYFLVACALRDIMRRFCRTCDDFTKFPDKAAIHLNDTHPALAVAELMRMLVDENDVPWETAWDITQRTCAFTNHTLQPEALEKWPVSLVEKMLPRHLEIIYEINHRFLETVAGIWTGDEDRQARMSLIEEGAEKQVRMAHLAMAGSHSVNGVSNLHTVLIKKELAPDFHEMWPQRFNNKTNGVTQRRWLLVANRELASLVTEKIGDAWIRDFQQVEALEGFAGDAEVQRRFLEIKQRNKETLAALIKDRTVLAVNPETLFDVHIKRIHEYKRQTLNIMHIIHDYLRIVEDGHEPAVPRTYVFAGIAAPGYWAAQQIIKMVHSVGGVINSDKRAHEFMKVVFIPDYEVSLAERIIPAADISEQVSMAGTEASGTSNMKFAMNGAITVGTPDGANIEIRDAVGEENFFSFGHAREDIVQRRQNGGYKPLDIHEGDERIKRVLGALRSSRFSEEEPGLFDWFVRKALEGGDPYFHLADFPSYLDAHDAAAKFYLNREDWARKCIESISRMGGFSSDRSVSEYAREIWHIEPVTG